MGSYRHNIAFRLNAWIIGVLAITVFIVGGSLVLIWARMAQKTIQTEGITQTEKTARSIDQECYFIQTLAESIANSISRECVGNESSTHKLNESFLAARTILAAASAGMTNANEAPIQVLGFMMVPQDGKYREILTITNDKESEIQEKRNFDYTTLTTYLVPLHTGKPFWGSAFTSQTGKPTPSIAYSVPVYATCSNSKKNQQSIVGVVFVQISLINLQKKLKNIDIWGTDLPCLMNEFGQILLHKRKQWMVNETVFSLAALTDHPNEAREAFTTILSKSSGHTTLDVSPLLEDERIVMHSRCANGWVIAIMHPPNWLMEQILPIFIVGTILTLLIAGMIVFIISLLIRKMTRPLVKLTKAVKTLEEGNFEIELPEYDRDDEIGQLTSSFGSMRLALIDQFENIKATTAEQERSQGELKAAMRIQHDLLPRFTPTFSKNPLFYIDAYLQVARGVGGDLYDFFMIDEYTLVLSIGDVAGKGVPASIFMGVTQTLHRSLSRTESNPAILVSHMNQHLERNNETMMFVTYFYAVIDLRTGLMTYTNAGHNKPWIRHADGSLECLNIVHGPPLGIALGNYECSTITLLPQDILFLYTDGVTESFNSEEELFGDDRLIQSLQTPDAGKTPSTCICSVCDALRDFVGSADQSDDIAMLAFSLKQQ